MLPLRSMFQFSLLMSFIYVSVTSSLRFLYTPINVLLTLALRFIFIREMLLKSKEFLVFLNKQHHFMFHYEHL